MDVALERHVAIKKYRPTSLAVRANPSLEVSMRSDRHRGSFDAGLKSFVNEARLLARFDHPSLVKVCRFCEANRTAYMAMPSYDGPTLNATLATADSTPSESQIRAWLELLLNALSVLHREHCYHRDISPDNILLTTSGPVLLDFGAARDQRHESPCRCDPKPGRKIWRNSGRCSMQGRLVRWLWCLPRRITRSHVRPTHWPLRARRQIQTIGSIR